jgi:sugar (pentulose or hexulose) kinase
MPGRDGRFVGPDAEGEELAAAALLYVALMTDLSLDLIRSGNTIVIDGGLVKTGHYGSLLAALRPGQRVLTSANAEGSAFGAATLAFESTGRNPFANECSEVERTTVQGLDAYRDEWRALAEANRSETRDAAQ